MKNMFEWHDSLHSKIGPEVSIEIPVNQNCDFNKFSGTMNQDAPTKISSKNSNAIPWKEITIASGILFLGYKLYMNSPNNYNPRTFFDRIRPAKKNNS